MTSKTSYFEPVLFLRGLKKTFPVWLAYVVLWILFLPLSILNRAQWDPKAADIRELILSSAIASNLAKGMDLEAAVEGAKVYISGALAAMLDLGKGRGPMNHLFDLKSSYIEGAEA